MVVHDGEVLRCSRWELLCFVDVATATACFVLCARDAVSFSCGLQQKIAQCI